MAGPQPPLILWCASMMPWTSMTYFVDSIGLLIISKSDWQIDFSNQTMVYIIELIGYLMKYVFQFGWSTHHLLFYDRLCIVTFIGFDFSFITNDCRRRAKFKKGVGFNESREGEAAEKFYNLRIFSIILLHLFSNELFRVGLGVTTLDRLESYPY